MSSRDFRRFFLVALLLSAVSSPVCAEAVVSQSGDARVSRTAFPGRPAERDGLGRPSYRPKGDTTAEATVKQRPTAAVGYVSDTVLWADVWNFGNFFTGGGRARIVQICVVLMCLGLFILMKKLNG